MADELQWIHYFNHSGGLNTRYSVTSTPPFDATEIQNIENIVRGGFRKISGYTRWVEAPLLASGTYLRGTLDPIAESDPWTGAGDAATFSTSGGIMTLTEGAGAEFIRYFNAEAGFTTGVDAAYECRKKVTAGYTASGVYVESFCVLDDGTKRLEVVALDVSGTKQIGVLTTTADRTVIGSYTSPTTHDWSAFTRLRVSFDGGATISIYVNDLTTAFITIAYSSLPASTETSRVAFGSFVAATVITSNTDYIVYKIGSTSLDTAPVTGIYDFIEEDGTQNILITSGTSVYRYDSSTADWVALTGGTAFTSGAKPHFVTFSDASASNNAICIITTESRNTVQKYGGGAAKANLGGTPPSGKYVEIYNERCWIANTSAEPSAVYHSALGDPEDRDDQAGTWDQTNDVFLMDRHRYGEITGLATTNHRLLVFSQKGINRIQGWGKGSFLRETVSNVHGCVAPNSIKKGPYGDARRDGVFFRDRDGYYWTDGEVGNIIRVSEKILTTMQVDFNASQVNNECAFLDKDRSLVGWGTSQGAETTNSKVYSLDYVVGPNRQDDQFAVEGWFATTHPMRAAGEIVTSGKDVILFSDHAGLVFRMNNGDTFDGAAYDAFRSTSWIFANAPHQDKLFRFLIVYTKSVGDWNLTVNWGSGFNDTYDNSDTVNLAGSSALLDTTFILDSSMLGTTGTVYKKIPLDIRTNALRLKFQNINADEPFTILGFSVGYEMAEDYFTSNA